MTTLLIALALAAVCVLATRRDKSDREQAGLQPLRVEVRSRETRRKPGR